jgi:Transcriptional regulator
MAKPHRSPASDGMEQLKSAAVRLFAERGIDGVTVRDITLAAGQRNHASIGYHFGSKDELVRAVIVHGARLIDELRNDMLDRLEAGGGPSSAEEVIECLLRSSLPAVSPWDECYNRFVVLIQLSNRSLFMEALEDRWNSGYLRCLDHIRRLMPGDPPDALNQKLLFLGASLGGILAARESAIADHSRAHPMWTDDRIIRRAAIALAAMVRSPVAEIAS